MQTPHQQQLKTPSGAGFSFMDLFSPKVANLISFGDQPNQAEAEPEQPTRKTSGLAAYSKQNKQSLPSDFADQLLENEMDLEKDFVTLETVNKLTELYSLAMAFYESEGNHKYKYFANKLQDLLMKPNVKEMMMREMAPAKTKTEEQQVKRLRLENKISKINAEREAFTVVKSQEYRDKELNKVLERNIQSQKDRIKQRLAEKKARSASRAQSVTYISDDNQSLPDENAQDFEKELEGVPKFNERPLLNDIAEVDETRYHTPPRKRTADGHMIFFEKGKAQKSFKFDFDVEDRKPMKGHARRHSSHQQPVVTVLAQKRTSRAQSFGNSKKPFPVENLKPLTNETDEQPLVVRKETKNQTIVEDCNEGENKSLNSVESAGKNQPVVHEEVYDNCESVVLLDADEPSDHEVEEEEEAQQVAQEVQEETVVEVQVEAEVEQVEAKEEEIKVEEVVEETQPEQVETKEEVQAEEQQVEAEPVEEARQEEVIEEAQIEQVETKEEVQIEEQQVEAKQEEVIEEAQIEQVETQAEEQQVETEVQEEVVEENQAEQTETKEEETKVEEVVEEAQAEQVETKEEVQAEEQQVEAKQEEVVEEAQDEQVEAKEEAQVEANIEEQPVASEVEQIEAKEEEIQAEVQQEEVIEEAQVEKTETQEEEIKVEEVVEETQIEQAEAKEEVAQVEEQEIPVETEQEKQEVVEEKTETVENIEEVKEQPEEVAQVQEEKVESPKEKKSRTRTDSEVADEKKLELMRQIDAEQKGLIEVFMKKQEEEREEVTKKIEEKYEQKIQNMKEDMDEDEIAGDMWQRALKKFTNDKETEINAALEKLGQDQVQEYEKYKKKLLQQKMFKLAELSE